MATAYKLNQVQGTASTGTYATLYTVPASTEAIVSTILICNTGTSSVTYRIGLMASAGTPAVANGEFIAYDATVAANDTVALTLGIVLEATQVIRVSSSANDLNFNAYVSEVS